MNIIHFLPTLEVGGAETIVVKTLVELKKRGHDSTLFVVSGHNSYLRKMLIDNNVRVIEVLSAKIIDSNRSDIIYLAFKYLYCAIKLILVRFLIRYTLSVKQYDIVHLHLDIIRYFRKCKKGRWFYTCHSTFDRYTKIYGNWWSKRLKSLTKSGMVILGISHEMVYEIQKRLPVAIVKYAPNWLDIRELSQRKMTKEQLWDLLGLPKGSFVISHVGRMVSVKNQEKSIDIVNRIVKRKGGLYYLLLIGTGDEKYISWLKKKCIDYDIENNVRFLGFREDVAEIISASDVCLLPSFVEGFSITTLEYQIYNKRCVISNAVPAEICCNSNCIRMDVHESDDKWAEQIIGMELSECSGNIEEFNMPNAVNKLLSIYSL